MTKKEVEKALQGAGQISKLTCKKNGNFVVMKTFFYTSGYSADKLWDLVKRAIPTASLVRKDTIWKPFKGGAKPQNDSRFEVEFKA